MVVYSILIEAPHDIIFYWKMGAWIDFALMSLTFFATIIWNVEVGVLLSVTISLLLVVHKSGKTRMTILVRCTFYVRSSCSSNSFFQGRVPGTERYQPVNEEPDAQEDLPGVLIVRIKESLDFGMSRHLLFCLLLTIGLSQHRPLEGSSSETRALRTQQEPPQRISYTRTARRVNLPPC